VDRAVARVFDSATLNCYIIRVLPAEFDLKTLCEKADVTPRTVHFYVQQGLLPPAGAPGPGARYGEGHVARLRLIRLLQKQHLPLAEIAKRLKGLSDRQVEQIVTEAHERRAAARGSALDYVRGVLSARRGTPEAASSPATVSVAYRLRAPAIEPGSAPARSQWERFTLAEGIELHVQRPLERLQQRRLDRLISAARQIFGEE
jgi:DNA-binding transcriptional MerR regulator